MNVSAMLLSSLITVQVAGKLKELKSPEDTLT